MVMDDLLVVIFCLVDDAIKALSLGRLRARGPQPTLADSEVITMELIGELYGLDRDKDLFAYFRRHHLREFPALACVHRTTLVRQAANLWKLKQLIQQHLAGLLIERQTFEDPLCIIDSFPLPVCRFARAPKCRRLAGIANNGFDHTANAVFYGLRVHLLCTDSGVITRLQLAPASIHDSDLAPEMAPPHTLTLGDRNYWDPALTVLLKQQDRHLMAPFRRKSTDPRPKFAKILSRLRQVIEPVIGQLAVRLNIKRTWARDLWHLCSRLYRKILAHTVATYLNTRLGNPPLQFALLLE